MKNLDPFRPSWININQLADPFLWIIIIDFFYFNSLYLATKTKSMSISGNKTAFSLGYVLPACQLHVFRWPPLDVSTDNRGVGLQMDKFEQVSSDGHQMSVAGV